MQTIHLHINGLTHRDIAERREEFLATAVGRSVVLRPAPQSFEQGTLEAFVGVDCVGVVSKLYLSLAWRAMPEGESVLRGRIVATEDYDLTVAIEVEKLRDAQPVVSALAEWKYEGPVMTSWPSMRKMDYLVGEMTRMLGEKNCDEVEFRGMMDAFCKAILFDISVDGLNMRTRLLELLMPEDSDFKRETSSQLREASRRMGGNTWTASLAAWIRQELATSDDVQRLLLEPMPVEMMVEAAKRLPCNLWELFKHDKVQFVRELYGAHPTREELLKVLSCLLWIEAHTVINYDEDIVSLDKLAECVLAEPTEKRRYESMSVLNNLLSDNPKWSSRVSYIKEEIKKAHEQEKNGRGNTTFNNYGTYNDIQPGGTNITNKQDGNN